MCTIAGQELLPYPPAPLPDAFTPPRGGLTPDERKFPLACAEPEDRVK